jgi:hypothetical protein
MGDIIDPLYDFVYRGQLTKQALDKAGRPRRQAMGEGDITTALSLELFDSEHLVAAQGMSIVYSAIAAFELSVRSFVSRVLIDEFGEDWWEKGVSEKIRKFAESRRDDEEKTKWHGVRGTDLLSYTELKHLGQIIGQHFNLFEPTVRSQEWANFILATIERSRNVIMHSGTLDMPDIERIGISMRDWNKQVGL